MFKRLPDDVLLPTGSAALADRVCLGTLVLLLVLGVLRIG